MRLLQRIMAEAKIVKPKVLVISGTTAVGKTDLSILLARRLRGEIISADSAQVFRGLDVGSAKVEPHLQEEISHHVIDVVGVKEKFSAGDFRDRAMRAIQEIHLKQKLPIIVGGTSLYIKMFLEGCSGSPPSTPEGQATVDEVVKGKSWDESVQQLAELDPGYASKLEVNDWYRLRRALEICLVSGKPVSSFKMEVDLEKLPFQCKCLFLSMPREKLYRRIDLRCEKIIQSGILKEVIDLVKHEGLSVDSQPGRCIGYRQTLEYLRDVWKFPPESGEGNAPLAQPGDMNGDMEKKFLEFLHHYQAETRQLAKGQLMWHKREPYFKWVDVSKMADLSRLAEAVAEWVTNDQGFPHELQLDGAHLKELSKETRVGMKYYTAELQIYSKRENILEALEEIRRLVL